MAHAETVIGVYANRHLAAAAVSDLTGAGYGIGSLSIVGKGFHTGEQVSGFYNTGDRVKFWGTREAFWGGLWGNPHVPPCVTLGTHGAFWGDLWELFHDGLFMTVPRVGHVVVLGNLAAALKTAAVRAAVIGGQSAIAVALNGVDIPQDRISHCEAAVDADAFLVMVHAAAGEVARAEDLLGRANPAPPTVQDARLSVPVQPVW